MRSTSFAKVWFVLSFAALSYLLGFATHSWELFPKEYLEEAYKQLKGETGALAAFNTSNLLTDRVYDRWGVRAPMPDSMQPGLTLITSSWKGSDGKLKPGLRLIDRNGSVLHKWRVDRSRLFQEVPKADPERASIHGSHLLPNGDIVINLSHIGIVRLDACGEVLWQTSEGRAHHSIARAEDGTFWVSGNSPEPRTQSPRYPDGFQGLGNKAVFHDLLVHVGADGEVLKKINVLNVLYENDLQRYIPRAYLPQATGAGELETEDLTHLNDVEPLSSSMAGGYSLFEAGDLLVSLHRLNLILVVDPDSRVVKWHTTTPFVQQHDPDYLGDGWIGVFDNNRDFTTRGAMSGGSRIVRINPEKDSVDILFPTRLSDSFYTPVRGKWQYLDNGNLLLTESQAGRVVEVDRNGRTVWEWVHEPMKEGEKVAHVSKAKRVSIDRKKVSNWSCDQKKSEKTLK